MTRAGSGTAGGADLLPVLGATTAVQIVTSATVLALSAIAPAVGAATGLPAHWVGYQVSLIYAAGAVSSAFAGAVIARFGPGRVEGLVLACLFVGMAGLLAADPWLAAAGSLVVGIGHGLNNPASSQLLDAVTPGARRNLVFSIKQTGVPIGGIAATLALPPLAEAEGWRAALVALMVLHLVLALPFVRHAAPDRPRRGEPPLARLRREQALLWRSPPLRALAAIGFLYSSAQLAISAYVVLLLHEAGGLSVAAVGAYAAILHGAGVLGRLGWGWVADRTRRGFGTLAAIGFLCALAATATLFFSDLPATARAAAIAVFGATAIGWNGVLLAETARGGGAGQVGAATGSVLVFVFAGAIVGPALVGAVYGLMENRFLSLLLPAGFSALGAVVALAAARSRAETA